MVLEGNLFLKSLNDFQSVFHYFGHHGRSTSFFAPLSLSSQYLDLIIRCASLEQLMGAVSHSFLEKSKNFHDDDDDYFNIMFYYYFFLVNVSELLSYVKNTQNFHIFMFLNSLFVFSHLKYFQGVFLPPYPSHLNILT